jgi:glycosyltransferase involved in cell wall biosynthesis
MKILHIQGKDLSVGSGRGALSLHLAQLEMGLDSTLLVADSDRNNSQIISITKNKWCKIKQRLINRLDETILKIYQNRERIIFSPSILGNNITKMEEYKKADIIHMHWINMGMIGISLFSKIQKPIVWTFRDMWPFTGGCHYSLGCDKYENMCGNCKILKSDRDYDLSRWIINRKKKHYGRNIYPVATSNWIKDCALRSCLFRNYKVQVIHNGINTKIFKPVDKEKARGILNLPKNKKIILFGAQNYKDIFKGHCLYLDAAKELRAEDYYHVYFGKINENELKNTGLKYRSMGFVDDDVNLAIIYSSADVFVAPSIQEAFGKTIIESMACGTPVVCFDATGPRDIVTHKEDGYKAKPYDTNDLLRGIRWILDNENHDILGINARSKVVGQFEINNIAKKYAILYEDILGINNQVI